MLKKSILIIHGRLFILQKESIVFRLNTYTKFVFSRDPVERIVSAFKDKFESHSKESYSFNKLYGNMIRKTVNSKNSSNGPISFQVNILSGGSEKKRPSDFLTIALFDIGIVNSDVIY